MAADPPDPFGTAAVRARVLAAWAASPARFREDANAEEDLVRGGYRDRVVVELAQNAADAATREGVPGRLQLVLRDGVLLASNTGAPLDAAGLESLCTLRASAKRDLPGSVGRFGVGFAAVLAVSDEPRIASSSGAVRWQTAAARAEAAAVAALAAELAHRGGAAPVLRLPYPDPREPATGWTTTVALPLRDEPAVRLVRRLLSEVDEVLLLALPALSEVSVEADGVRRVLAGDQRRWRVVRRAGPVPPELLADRPLEERDRPWWGLTWALPAAGQPLPGVLHAPTPTDEPLGLPALLVGSFPLDPTRRHVAPGPLTDALVGLAATAYGELARAADDPLALVPGPVPLGRLDAQLRSAVTDVLRNTRLLSTTDGERVAPADAVAVTGADPPLRTLLAQACGPLVADHPALPRLGGRRLSLAEAVEALAALDRPPGWWHALYTALAAAGANDPEVLGVLPVPLADGRLVRGGRGALLPEPGLVAGPAGLDLPGLRLVHAEAVHPLLRRAGATDAGPRTLLEAPEVRAAVEAAWDDPDPTAVAAVVLPLVAAAALRPGELPWLAGLPLPAQDGEPAAADELVLPGSALAAVADSEVVSPVASDPAVRWGDDVLAAVGVLSRFTVTELRDVVLDEDAVDEPLEGWVRHCLGVVAPSSRPPTARVVRVVPELDVVDDDRWPQVLRLLSGEPEVRAAVVTPVRLDLGGGRSVEVTSYAGWLLAHRVLLGGRPAGDWTLPDSDLAGLYDVLDPAWLTGVDPLVLAAAGVRASLAEVLARPAAADDLLARLGDPARSVTEDTWRRLWPLLAGLDDADLAPPRWIRVTPELVVDAAQVVVVDRPEHLQVVGEEALVVPLPLAQRLADLLDLDLSSEVVARPDLAGGVRQPVPAPARAVVPGLPDTWWEHDDLVASGRSVSWWRDDAGEVHATTYDGLARGLAAEAGRWPDRLLVAAALESPGQVTALTAEARLEV